MATGQDIIDEVRTQLLEPVAGFWTDAELLTKLNKAEKEFTNRVRGVVERVTTLSLKAGDNFYPLPPDWLSSQGVFFKEVDGTNFKWRRLNPTTLEKKAQENPNFHDTGVDRRADPREYWLWGRKIYVDPTPKTDGDGDLKLYYNGKSTPLTNLSQTVNIDDSLIDALEAYILREAWKKEKESNLSDREDARYERKIKEGRRWVKLRPGDMKHRIDLESNRKFTTTSGISGINPFE